MEGSKCCFYTESTQYEQRLYTDNPKSYVKIISPLFRASCTSPKCPDNMLTGKGNVQI